ncbi:hypothetical protein KQI42_11790 [Tissierella sp. MSJ-40]|uniref:Uncharacterized protein n=1 Tax=Tissierella simiarum TaxID=2841534 RepID=A0ABS6E905_9FIRM|nr:hypothetical protein [Tissierella simiarum]MBU5438698.1 hypothetical protein [Tissierella simiarum]
MVIKIKKLYREIGYVEVGSIADFYKKGIKEYLMVKDVTSITDIAQDKDIYLEEIHSVASQNK